MTERSPKYGLSDRTRKPVSLACNELSRAINALDQHHADEAEGFEASLATATATLEGLPTTEAARPAQAIEVIKHAAARLRAARQSVLKPLLALRPQLVDVLLEGHDMLPDNALMTAHVEPEPPQEVPRPLGGIELDHASAVRVLGETYGWTREVTHSYGVLAIGPLYMLGLIIEQPTPEASKLRADARAVREQVRRRLLHQALRG